MFEKIGKFIRELFVGKQEPTDTGTHVRVESTAPVVAPEPVAAPQAEQPKPEAKAPRKAKKDNVVVAPIKKQKVETPPPAEPKPTKPRKPRTPKK